MNEILVIGHRNPDTDAICSAIGYAEFKRRTGLPGAVAARCGDTNDRIDFVLRTFQVPPPKFVADVSPKVGDVMQRNVISALPDTPVAEALAIMEENNLRALPVLDEHRQCRGLVSVFKINQFYLPAPHRLFESRRVIATLSSIARTVNARILHAVDIDREDDLIMMIGAMSDESFTRRLSRYPAGKLIVVIGDRGPIQAMCVQAGVRCLVVTGGMPVDPALLENARKRGVAILSSMHDSLTTALLCRAAISVSHMLHEDFLALREDDHIRRAQRVALDSHFPAYPVTNERGETVGILSKSDFLKKVQRQLILVDHNELTQAVHGADEAEIIEVIDHHRLGAMRTTQPIFFLNDPVGSTSTIVADCFFRHGVELPKTIAGLLLAGLVSDTLNLTSPTTTSRDAAVLKRLEEASGVVATDFTEKLFSSGSILISKPADQAITADCKEYAEGPWRFSVAQIEEIGFDNFWKRKAEVLEALEKFQRQQRLSFSALLVTDVVEQTSLLLLAGDPTVIQTVDHPVAEPGIFRMPDVVSRKKQLLPYLTHCLQKLSQTGKRD